MKTAITTQEFLKQNPKKEIRKDIISFLAFSLLVMFPLAWLVVDQLSA